MEFSLHLYMDEKIKNREKKIVEKLKRNEFVPFVHVITLPIGKDGMLEIYPAYVLKQEIYRNLPIHVVGLASGHDEACELARQMVDESLKKMGTTDVRELFRQE